MRSILSLPHALRLGLALTTTLPCLAIAAASAYAAPKGKAAASPAAKKSAKEISSTDDALQKQMDWENKILGPNTEKKIDLAKIQKLQAEETARREKQEKIDKVDRERKEREMAAKEAAQRNVHAPSSREVPEIQETPPPPKAEKHDDAFVDKLLKEKSLPKKKASVTNDEVDELLNAAKQEKPGQMAKGKGKGGDTVDQLLATADKQPTIKTTTKRPAATDEPVSAEAASREAAMKAIAAAAAKADEERGRNKKPAIPDAAVLRARAEANARANPSSSPLRPAAASTSKAGWSDPFAAESDSSVSSKRGKVSATVRPPSPDLDSEPAPTKRGASRGAPGGGWKDPFDAGDNAPTRARPAAPAKAPAGKAPKHPPNWKDPFA
jgi:hypothetical protein